MPLYTTTTDVAGMLPDDFGPLVVQPAPDPSTHPVCGVWTRWR